MNKRVPSDRDLKKRYGISTSYELMENGEFRSRMTPSDGNGYIRTVASSVGSWQKAHFHSNLRETYIVETGWIASAELADGILLISKHFPGAVFTTQPKLSHNIYMSANSVIHTVKHGGVQSNDWHEDSDLTRRTRELSEEDIISFKSSGPSEDRFDSYMSLYNNLDKLLWSVPGFLGIGGAVIIGFFGSILSREPAPDISPIVFSGVFLFASLLFFLGFSSMSRLREHHTAVGNHLGNMERGPGYFTFRATTVARWWPISATLYFRVAYAFLSALLGVIAITVIAFPSTLDQILDH